MLGPTSALLLLLAGAGFLCWEFLRPGSILPGICGGVCTVTGIVSLPWNASSVGLFCGGLVCLGLQTYLRFYFIPALLAVCAFALLPATLKAHWFLILPIAGETVCLAVLLRIAIRARRNKLSVE